MSQNNPAWTLDGREIIFSDGSPSLWIGNSGALWRVAVARSGEPQPLAIAENTFELCVSRQGHRLVYSREVSDANIWRVEISGPQARPAIQERFIFSTQQETNPQISPDGKKIAFYSTRSGRGEIWTCDYDGSNPVQLT